MSVKRDEAQDATLPPSLDEPPPKASRAVAETLPAAAQASTSAPATSRFPVENWDRYELLAQIGQGGMGTVFQARDKRLGRVVALKFILGTHPNLVMRLLQEARAQARIDHPNICHVYEVGEVDRRAYIAMQFVAGEQLGKASAKLSLDEKVAVMRDVALAIHEAHKLGIVHRDLKPANIMVERTEDRRWFPVVMDFGLAREATVEAGLTESGALLGTPAYMAPEQARGDLRAVDRRSDVYSLGATFYELITGRPPFAQRGLAVTLEDVIKGEPPAPRSLVATTPIDLETIALKCLAKEPERRYASARALAEDLERYLDGEPILGRRPSLARRLRLRAQRHRALVAVSFSSLLAILAVATLGIRAALISWRERTRAAERARLAESLGHEAKEIEWVLRVAYQLPLHDTTPERELTRARMQKIAATKHDLGPLGDGVIHDALGRGQLALHQWSQAEDQLARAAASGIDSPGLHAARGRALGELYHRAREDARRSGDKEWLARREHELDEKYLTPALRELDRSRGMAEVGADPALLEAWLALYRRDYARAESRGLEAVARKPWLFEARKVASDAAYEAAHDKLDHGDYDAARAGFAHAAALYARAAEVARSDASVHEAAAQTWLQQAEVDFRQGRAGKEAIDNALAAVDKAIVADPHDATALTTKAYVLLRSYLTPALRAKDERGELEALAQVAARATTIDARDAQAWDALGSAHLYRGRYEMTHGGDPAQWWNQSLREIGTSLSIEPNNPWANNDLGVVHRWMGLQLVNTGHDPMAEYEAAMRAYERAARIDPLYLYAVSNQADIEATIANYQATHGKDPAAAVSAARRAGERCVAIDRSYADAYGIVAYAELDLADYQAGAGIDPTLALTHARAQIDRAIAVQPNIPHPFMLRIRAAHIDAIYRAHHGRDASTTLKLGYAAYQQLLRLGSDSDIVSTEVAGLDIAAAEVARQARQDVAPHLRQAVTHARHAVAINPENGDAFGLWARAATMLGGEAMLRDATAAVNEALRIDPRSADAHAVRAAILLRRAHAKNDADARREAASEAAQALAINPLLRLEWGEELREVLQP
jgi:serine/threonine-protein kinase